jgi:hypothetical protein
MCPVAVAAIAVGVGMEVKEDVAVLVGVSVDMVNQNCPLEPNLSVNSARRLATWSPVAGNGLIGTSLSHSVLRPNRMLIVCVLRNQIYTLTVQKMDTK